MNEKEVNEIENEHNKFLKRTIVILISIPIVVFIIIFAYIMYWLLGKNTVNLKNITDIDKSELIELLNLEIENDDIEFEKLETPKTYKDISYGIYFSINSKYKQNVKNISSNNLEADFREITVKSDKIKYYGSICFQGKSIEILEKIREKY